MIRILTTFCLVAAGFGPLLLDIGDTHLFNPDWDEHARVHEVWRLSTNALIGLLGLYLIWYKDKNLLPALLSACMIVGFAVSVITMPLYDGLSVGNNINELTIFGVPLNILSFILVGFIQSFSIFLIYKLKRPSN